MVKRIDAMEGNAELDSVGIVSGKALKKRATPGQHIVAAKEFYDERERREGVAQEIGVDKELPMEKVVDVEKAKKKMREIIFAVRDGKMDMNDAITKLREVKCAGGAWWPGFVGAFKEVAQGHESVTLNLLAVVIDQR